MRKIGFDDLIEPPIIAAIRVLLAWLWARGVNSAAKLDHLAMFQRLGIVYGAWFFLGMAYILNIAGALNLPEGNSIALVLAWMAVLGGTQTCYPVVKQICSPRKT
jgi:hypothetical protein